MHFQVVSLVIQFQKNYKGELTFWKHFQVALSVMQSQRWTYSLDAFSGCLISYAIPEELQRWTHKLDVFLGHVISYSMLEES